MRFRSCFATAWLCAAALLTTPRNAAAQAIEIAQFADGSSCYMPMIPPGGSGTAYIYVILAGAVSGGITGAEFAILGMPPEMMVSVTPNPASNVTLGNPFGTGCNIAFPTCQTGPLIVLLYTVHLAVPPSGVPHYVLQVTQHQVPSGPNLNCPLVTKCDPPDFTKVCVVGGRSGPGPLLPVPANPSPADAMTDVETTTDLAWELTGPGFCCGLGTPFTTVYFGTQPDPPPVSTYETGELSYDPGALAPLTTYYWRIVWTPDHDCGTRSGPIWSFTTSDKVGVEPATWQGLKGLFR